MSERFEVHEVSGERAYCRALDAEMDVSDRLCASCPLCAGGTGRCAYRDGDDHVFPRFIGNGRWTEIHRPYEDALMYAAEAHRGDVRKGTDIPYIVHPMEASMIALSITDDMDIVAAAALHDVVEDAGKSLEELADRFGPAVAEIVGHESEDKRPDLPPSESWGIRKQEFMDSLEDAPYGAKVVALADKLSNMRSIAEDHRRLGDALWERFNQKDKSKQAWYYRGIADILEADLGGTGAWREYSMLCDEVFGHRGRTSDDT